MNCPPKSSSDLGEISSTQDGGASNNPNVVTNPLTGESVGSSSPETLKKVVEEKCLDFIKDAALLDPKECVERLGSPEGNIFHIAASQNNVEFMANNVEFMAKAMRILPRPITQSLLSQGSEKSDKRNPLHIVASDGYRKMVKIILDFYRPSASSSDNQSTNETTGEKPWLGLDNDKSTPLHSALRNCNERIALEILSMDVESLSSIEDSENRGPLFIAMENWLYRVALQILTSAPNCSLSGNSGQTALTVAPNAPDHIFDRLVEEAPRLLVGQDHSRDTVLHHWVRSGTVRPVEFVVDNGDIAPDLRRDFIDQLSKTNKRRSNPLHLIIRSFVDDASSVKMAKVLVNAYKRERKELFASPKFQPPWLMKDRFGKTPLDAAIVNKNEQLASYLLSVDQMKFLENNDDLLFYSIRHECPKVALDMLGIVLQTPSLTKLLTRDKYGQNALHFAPKCTEENGRLIVEKWPELINDRDKDGQTPLETASKAGASWLVELILQKDRSWIFAVSIDILLCTTSKVYITRIIKHS